MGTRCLEHLGYDRWLRHVNPEPLGDGFRPARVIEVNKNSYVVSDGCHEMVAELSGKFLFDAEESEDYPTVGDWVAIQALDNHTMAIVHSRLPRTTLLKRKEPGRRIGFQLIAANIDVGLVVQSAKQCNRNLLERYFVMLNESRIQPVAVFSKIDLLSSSEREALQSELSTLRHPYLLISTTAEEGIEELSKILGPGTTYCLLGQSGVGKTSLLNRLLGTDAFKVSAVREKDGKGRHTTVRRQLIRLDCGAIFIDTPGMRELGNFAVEEGLEQTFDEFASSASACRFSDCTHTHEAGCAILAAVEEGKIDEGRYRNYLKLKKESAFYAMSYQEKRKRDKSFGKMVKQFKKRGVGPR
jgi:ribosome biogenesis GTPase